MRGNALTRNKGIETKALEAKVSEDKAIEEASKDEETLEEEATMEDKTPMQGTSQLKPNPPLNTNSMPLCRMPLLNKWPKLTSTSRRT